MPGIQDTIKLSLISKRQDIINFTQAICADDVKLSIASDFSSISVQEPKLVLIDASLFNDFDIEVLESAEKCARFAICILPSDIPIQVASYVEKTFQYIVSFPINTEYFRTYYLRVRKTILKSDKENVAPKKDQLSVPDSLSGYFGGTSPLIKSVRRQILRASYSNEPVLILGETGVGKTTAAEVIHDLSDRRNKKLITVDPSAIVGTLSESSFFGHIRGSYTSADYERRGYFEEANGSTLFFDEFGVASLSVQAMLLSVLETGKYKKIGDNRDRRVDVRMIFATNADIELMLRTGDFRQDLYFRIFDNLIKIPPLRERKEDIRGMVLRYLDADTIISEDAMELLENYSWPGNIRELHKRLKNAVDNSSNKVITADLIDFGEINFLQ